jgi:hypothetical protein
MTKMGGTLSLDGLEEEITSLPKSATPNGASSSTGTKGAGGGAPPVPPRRADGPGLVAALKQLNDTLGRTEAYLGSAVSVLSDRLTTIEGNVAKLDETLSRITRMESMLDDSNASSRELARLADLRLDRVEQAARAGDLRRLLAAEGRAPDAEVAAVRLSAAIPTPPPPVACTPGPTTTPPESAAKSQPPSVPVATVGATPVVASGTTVLTTNGVDIPEIKPIRRTMRR